MISWTAIIGEYRLTEALGPKLIVLGYQGMRLLGSRGEKGSDIKGGVVERSDISVLGVEKLSVKKNPPGRI